MYDYDVPDRLEDLESEQDDSLMDEDLDIGDSYYIHND